MTDAGVPDPAYAGPSESPARIRLCAVAQNEGAHLAAWVHHHLSLGFDAVEVWVNGSQDGSVEIMEAIAAVRDDVTFRVADHLLEDSIRRGKYFQYRAYAKMARRARGEGFTHAAFLDLDEYWVPHDPSARIHDFVPLDPETNVVSFPWGFDLPDPTRPAFDPPLRPRFDVVMDRHVKSLVRLDDRVAQIRPHTTRTESGHRLWVREPFPMTEEQQESLQFGSLLAPDDFEARRSALPEAFVLHAVNRSVTEYVASLKKAWRRSEDDSPYRTNRDGYLPAPGPLLPVVWGEEAVAAARASYEAFLAETGTQALVQQARASNAERAAEVVAELQGDRLLLEQQVRALRGVPLPALDEALPGWDRHLEWWVDRCELDDDGVRVHGWAFTTEGAGEVELALRGGDGAEHAPAEVVRLPRPDVRERHPAAVLDSGYLVRLPAALAQDPAVRILARPAGGSLWHSIDLTAHLARLPGRIARPQLEAGETASGPPPAGEGGRGPGGWRRRLPWTRSKKVD